MPVVACWSPCLLLTQNAFPFSSAPTDGFLVFCRAITFPPLLTNSGFAFISPRLWFNIQRLSFPPSDRHDHLRTADARQAGLLGIPTVATGYAADWLPPSVSFPLDHPLLALQLQSTRYPFVAFLGILVFPLGGTVRFVASSWLSPQVILIWWIKTLLPSIDCVFCDPPDPLDCFTSLYKFLSSFLAPSDPFFTSFPRHIDAGNHNRFYADSGTRVLSLSSPATPSPLDFWTYWPGLMIP